MVDANIPKEVINSGIRWERFPKSTQAAFRGVLEDSTLSLYGEADSSEDYTDRVGGAIRSVSEAGNYLTLSNRQVANYCVELAVRAEERGDGRLAEDFYYLADIARAMIRPNKK